MQVILISGKAQSGKDTFGKALQLAFQNEGKRVLIIHYADFLKFFCRQYLGWNGLKDEFGRKLLQYEGTDVFRKNYPNCWVDIMVGLLRGCQSEYDFVLIPDVRFPNEVDDLIEYNNALCKDDAEFATDIWAIRVERPNYDNGLTEEQKAHSSETALDDYPFEHYYLNMKDTLLEVEEDAVEWVEVILHKKEQ